MPQYLKDTETAARFGVSRATIWGWTRARTFPAPVQLSPGCTRWRVADLEAWEADRAAARPTAPATAA